MADHPTETIVVTLGYQHPDELARTYYARHMSLARLSALIDVMDQFADDDAASEGAQDGR